MTILELTEYIVVNVEFKQIAHYIKICPSQMLSEIIKFIKMYIKMRYTFGKQEPKQKNFKIVLVIRFDFLFCLKKAI